jgi:hypothetical protein
VAGATCSGLSEAVSGNCHSSLDTAFRRAAETRNHSRFAGFDESAFGLRIQITEASTLDIRMRF